jgi:diguanylate cyclase (GGDEF)-like protein
MSNAPGPYPRPPLMMIVTRQEWVSLSVETLFSPRGYAALHGDYSSTQALERLRETPVDLLVVDRDLKDVSGVDLCRAVRQKGVLAPTAPIVLLGAGPWPQEQKLEALRAGVWETCSLPTDSEELFVRVDTWVRAKLWADAVRIQGLLDPDTGLYNAQGLLRRVTEAGASALRHSRPLGCVVMSAELVPDRTRTFASNGASETTVRTVAAALRAQGRASDSIGRLSGNEFVIVAPDTDSAGVQGLVDRIRTAMEAMAAAPDAAPFRVRFGCYAVSNFGEASIAPTEMLVRAAEALRREDTESTVRFFASPAGLD